ncbi:MAG: Maf family protein [Lachnospiraceae bacterium]|nr:Maf family protein [Lachnospiraceae bacterium]
MKTIILASGSPRRKEILKNHNIPFQVEVSDVDESCGEMSPKELVKELSLRKAKAVSKHHPFDIVLGADTVVAFHDQILGKPCDDENAYDMIHMLQGNRHQVYTGVTICAGEKITTFYEMTEVEVSPMTQDEITSYIATGEGRDKAGSYAIQGEFGAYITAFHGDYENVVGLPGKRVLEVLQKEFL